MSSSISQRFGLFGPEVSLQGERSFDIEFQTLVTCLHTLDRDTYEQVLQRSVWEGRIQKHDQRHDMPWVPFEASLEFMINVLTRHVGIHLHLPMSDDSILQVKSDFYQNGALVMVLTLLEKLKDLHISTPVIRRLCRDKDRLNKLLRRIDKFGPSGLKAAVLAQMELQVQQLEKAYPHLWRDVYGPMWAEDTNRNSVLAMHTALCDSYTIAMYEQIKLKRLYAVESNPLVVMQEHATLLTICLAALYQTYARDEVHAAMADAMARLDLEWRAIVAENEGKREMQEDSAPAKVPEESVQQTAGRRRPSLHVVK